MKTSLFKEIINMAFDSLRSHKLRSFLTLLGIMIGVTTVIGMVSVIQGLNKAFLSELEALGSDIIIISKHKPGVRITSDEERKKKNLSLEDLEAIERECSLVKAVAVTLVVDPYSETKIKSGNIQNLDALVIGVNEKYPQVLSVYLPQKGRFITSTDVRHTRRVCTLGYEAAETLFPHTEPLGKEIRIGPEKFTVVGVLQKRGVIFGQSQDNFVNIPITTLMKYYPYDLSNLEFIAIPSKHEMIDEAIEQIINVLRKRRNIGFGEANDFEIYTQESIISLYNQITSAAYLVMVVISSIGLLVGGIGVMNIMLVSVKERTQEIGIRKAIGARPSDILKQFLAEAIFLTTTGGAVGILAGYGISFIVKLTTPLPASVTMWSVVLGFLVSVSVGLFFGIFPAQKASRLDPIIALRYE